MENLSNLPSARVTREVVPTSFYVFHWTIIIFTAGLWWPIYRCLLAARRRPRSVSYRV